MSDWNWAKRRDQAIVILAGLVLLGTLLWVLGHIMRPIVIVLLAVVIAYALEPVLSRLERFMPRVVAALLSYIIGALVVGGLAYFLLAPLVFQSHELFVRLPTYFERSDQWLNAQAASVGIQLPPPNQAQGTVFSYVGSGLREIVLQAISVVAVAARALVDVALILLLAYWFMVDGKRIRDAFGYLVPGEQRQRVQFLEETISQVLGGYIRGQLTMALIIAVISGVGCWLLGVPYPIVIAVLAFFFELVPMVGPILAALPALLIAAFQPFPLVVWVLIFFLATQFVENNILAPRISGGAVGLHPVAAILALVIGSDLGGIIGALFALPAASAASVLISAGLKSWRGEPVIVKRGGLTFRMPRRKREPVAPVGPR
ncbi:MAG: AI-2E family transporter [Chloroflexi bacterium]|nr:MAG: AI-2E family transporter [Chloroflexota bacterium]